MNSFFVLIDTKTNTYSRYSGRTMLNQIRTEVPLGAFWIEVLRARPQDILPQEEPVLA